MGDSIDGLSDTIQPAPTTPKKKQSVSDLLMLFGARATPDSQSPRFSSFSQSSSDASIAMGVNSPSVWDSPVNSPHPKAFQEQAHLPVTPPASQPAATLDHDEPNSISPSPMSMDVPRRVSQRSTKGNLYRTDSVQTEAPRVKRTVKQKRLLSNASTETVDGPPAKTSRALVRDAISLTTKRNRDKFLLDNKAYILPLLPDSHNYLHTLVDSGHRHEAPIPFARIQKQPHHVNATIKPYQLDGVSFLIHMNSNGMPAILADEMGLGKTLQTLSLFQYLHNERVSNPTDEARPHLVICPLSVLGSWASEAEKWVPNLKVMRFHGPSTARGALKARALGKADEPGHFIGRERAGGEATNAIPDVIITTYEMFVAEQRWFKTAFAWRYCVLDEGHKIKNHKSDVAMALQSLQAEYRLLLTGTPLQNDLRELWALFHWLLPDVFPAKTEARFDEAFKLSQGKVSSTFIADAGRFLGMIMLRRMKSDPEFNLGLPPKHEIRLCVPLTKFQRQWYTRLLTRENFDNLKKILDDTAQPSAADTTSATANKAPAWRRLMHLIIRLRQCCVHPYLIPGVTPDPYILDDTARSASGKFVVLDKLLDELVIRRKQKVLIFSGFTSALDCTEDLLAWKEMNEGNGLQYLRLDGGTCTARRNLAIRLFNDPQSPYKIMPISTKAGGLGLNLASASNVIFLDFDWNPQVDLQAEARAHRIGQTQPVTVYKLCTQGTVEEQMLSRITKKLYLSTRVMSSTQSTLMKGTKRRRSDAGEGVDEDEDSVPQMTTSELAPLVRRGTMALKERIEATEMSAWTFEEMLARCKDTAMSDGTGAIDDPIDLDAAENDSTAEQAWLASLERVKCTTFDGVTYDRNKKQKTTQPELLDTPRAIKSRNSHG